MAAPMINASSVNLDTASSSQFELASPTSSRTPYTAQAGTSKKAADVLSQIDNAGFSWFHLKTVIIAGMGFFCDSYDLFSISLVSKTIGRLYYPDESYRCIQGTTPSKNCQKILTNIGWQAGDAWDQQKFDQYVPAAIPENTANAITAIALCGTLAGQLLFGYLGDRLGRRRVFAWSLYFMIIFCAAQAFSFGSSASAVVSTLLFFRFWLGVGIGGDYPLSATLMSEYSSRSNRGAFIAAVFAMQGIGYLAAATFAIIMSQIWMASGANPDHLWRIVLAFGSVPTALTMYARLNMPETPRFTAFVQQDANTLVDDMNYVLTTQTTREQAANADANLPASLRGDAPIVRSQLAVKQGVVSYTEFFQKYGLRLFGTASTWFLLDIAFYSQNLSQPDVFSTAGWLPSAFTMTISEEAYRVARAQAIIALSSTVPGYWFTVFTIERMGRWNIQMMGFFFMTLFMGVLAGAYNSLVPSNVGGFVTLYALTFFFANWGPNATTFVVPAEVFPTRFRTLGHGISAACGKAGAIVGAFGFQYMKTNVSLQAALGLLTGINFLGMVCTVFVPETAGKSLEELGDEEIKTEAVTEPGTAELVNVNPKAVPV